METDLPTETIQYIKSVWADTLQQIQVQNCIPDSTQVFLNEVGLPTNASIIDRKLAIWSILGAPELVASQHEPNIRFDFDTITFTAPDGGKYCKIGTYHNRFTDLDYDIVIKGGNAIYFYLASGSKIPEIPLPKQYESWWIPPLEIYPVNSDISRLILFITLYLDNTLERVKLSLKLNDKTKPKDEYKSIDQQLHNAVLSLERQFHSYDETIMQNKNSWWNTIIDYLKYPD